VSERVGDGSAPVRRLGLKQVIVSPVR